MFYTSFCASVAFLDIRSSSHLHFLMLSTGKLPKLFYAKIATFIEFYFCPEKIDYQILCHGGPNWSQLLGQVCQGRKQGLKRNKPFAHLLACVQGKNF